VTFAHCRLEVRLDTSLELVLGRLHEDTAGKVLATTVSTAGSTYRKSGARMLILSDGSHVGHLSGGYLEGDLQLYADQVLRSGIARASTPQIRQRHCTVVLPMRRGCREVLLRLGPLDVSAKALDRGSKFRRSSHRSVVGVVGEPARLRRQLTASMLDAHVLLLLLIFALVKTRKRGKWSS
jgi:xanthine/CO dehydrogenase XdhC/CoxF family maturation factor